MVCVQVLVVRVGRRLAALSNDANLREVVAGTEARARAFDVRHFGRCGRLAPTHHYAAGEIDPLVPRGNRNAERLADVRTNSAGTAAAKGVGSPVRDGLRLIDGEILW